MFCYKCGNKISDAAKFCPFCGSRVPVMGSNAASPNVGSDRQMTYTPGQVREQNNRYATGADRTAGQGTGTNRYGNAERGKSVNRNGDRTITSPDSSETARCVVFLIVIALIVVAFFGVRKLNRPSGTYVAANGFTSQSFTFKGDEVTMSAFGINATGKYTITDGTMKVSYRMFGQDYTWSCSIKLDGKKLYMDGEEFIKQ